MTRIAITGAGVVCGLGRTVEEVWQALCGGRSALAPIRHWDATGWPRALAAEVAEADATALLADRRARKLMRRSHAFGVVAGLAAVEAAGWRAARDAAADAEVFNDRTALYVATGGGNYRDAYDFLPLLARSGGALPAFGSELLHAVPPMWLLQTLPNNALCHLGIQTGFSGPHACLVTHSSGGVLAIGEAVAALRAGEVDRAVAVAHEAPIEPQQLQGYATLGLLAEHAVRPFDARRDGCVLGEGGVALALEPLEAARGRGASMLGEVLGSGAAGEACGVFDVRPDGDGLVRAIGAALSDAGCAPRDVALIVAHGNGTRASDASEAAALRQVFGAACPPVTAFKWALGHLLAAAAPLETLLALQALHGGVAPGIATLERRDPACGDLPVSRDPRPLRGDTALILSRGFAGTDAALLVRTGTA
ncbi:MAG: beta-ketoacyl synthase N-terminal-like domain-containing protein [Deltaproteobacteria bacterium]|nr:beta-ketoacyl synthase N-terminal-like domain-containing protein [Deltaproteobacteria bacterium]